MTWVRRQPALRVHKCPCPMREAVYMLPSMTFSSEMLEYREVVPNGREGDLWRCPVCRRLWLHAYGCERCRWDGYHGGHYAGLILRPVWMPARWWQRLMFYGK